MADTKDTKLLTLTEVSKRTGISMPTLQRYKKLYQDRIPAEGTGRSQRYLPAALAVFKELKKENILKRGRPRKTAAAKAPAARRAKAKPKTKVKAKPVAKKRAKAKPKRAARTVTKKSATSDLLTLTQIGKLTGISYPTLLRYVRMHLAKIPHKGSGRARRYLPEAVDIFTALRQNSPRGRAAAKGKAAGGKRAAKRTAATAAGDRALVARLKELEKGQKQLVRHLAKLEKVLNKPIKLEVKRS